VYTAHSEVIKQQVGGDIMASVDTNFNFTITGMDCAGCARSLETGVSQLTGVESCELNFTTEKMRVLGDVTHDVIVNRVRELGFDVVEPQTEANTQANRTQALNFWQFIWQRRETQLALLGAVLILPGLIFEEILTIQHPLIDFMSLLALVVAGLPIARSAWRALRINREININVLMTIASIGAVLIGAYTEAGMVMVLFAMGEALEGYTAARARNTIRSLMQVMPNEAIRLDTHDDHVDESVVNVNQLRVGDLIVVKPGERIPMDGQVMKGASAVNQAPITGESRLVDKEVGSDVFASTINGEGALEIEVTRLAADNTISRLIKMVEEAQEKRAPAQRVVDQFAKYYTPAVVLLAFLVATIPPLLFNQPFFNPDANTFGWLYRGLALLVVACPCALVISTPVSIISAISNAAQHGVLIKGGAYLEALSKIKGMALDKTGTLTQGKPAVIRFRSADCSDMINHNAQSCGECDDMLALASAVEMRSEHPYGKAVVDESLQRNMQHRYPAAEMVTALTGRGIVGQVNGRQITIGSHTYFDDHIPHSKMHCSEARSDAQNGYTPLMVGAEGEYLGTITVADTVRESSREAIQQLKQVGIDTVVMLTGDNHATAQSVGAELGITDIRAELLPEHKVDAIKRLQQEYGPMAMIGDGINDAPALATAAVSIAIGGAFGGTSQAMETADITLMSDDLRKLPFAYQLSKATMRTIHTNVALSIGIKLVFLGLVLVGTGTMWMAVLADVGTSLLVTGNGMRLLRRESAL